MQGFSLNSIKKSYIYDQDKIIDPEKTVKLVLEKLKKVFPNKFFDLTNVSENGFEVFDFLDGDYVQRGKGATSNQSKASAIMEFVERFSWKNFDYLNNPTYLKLSYSNLSDIDKINFDIFLDKFLRGRDKELKPYLERINFDFIKGVSLITDSERLYPLNFNNIAQTSNGMCSGNCKEEAILQGICEIIERHNLGFLIQNLNSIDFNLIELNSIRDKLTLEIIDKLNRLNIDIFIVNLTLDFKVPTFMVCGKDNNLTENDFGFIGYGYGTQANSEKALLRALTEYVQMRELNEKYDSKSVFLKKRQGLNANFQFTLKKEVFTKILGNKNYISLSLVKDLSNDDLLIELNNIFDIFKEKNFELIVIDKTLPILNIPVFRVWSPNLMIGTHFDSNFDNLHSQTLDLIYESGDFDLANSFYKSYFDKILFDEDSADLNLMLENYPLITRDILRKYISSENYPISIFKSKSYLGYIDSKKK